jgi:hypothetical protein
VLSELTPGELVVVRYGAIVNRHGFNEEMYTTCPLAALVIQKSHEWKEVTEDDRLVSATYIVLMSDDSRMYLVSRADLVHPDQATDPSRLFTRLSG